MAHELISAPKILSPQMKVTSWEELMEVIDMNGDGMVSLEEMERQAFNVPVSVFRCLGLFPSLCVSACSACLLVLPVRPSVNLTI